MKRFFVVLTILAFSFLQLGCASNSYARKHPFKTAFYIIGIAATAGLLAYSASQAKSGYAAPQNNYVNGYYRADGTYVRPHYRTSPDNSIANNYGHPSYKQIQQYGNSAVIPTYLYDFDSDGITNQYDYDDDNDGFADSYDNAPYNSYMH